MAFTLRPYQLAAVDACFARWAERDRSTLLVMPTGTGKTIVFAAVAEKHRASGGGRVLVLAHREELLDQAFDKFRRATKLTVGFEAGSRSAWSSLHALDVVVASVQTLSRAKRLLRYARDAFDLVIVDEAHHAPSSSYQSILAQFFRARVLGVTATPDRTDGLAMGRVFQSAAFTYDIRQAIADGWLVPIRQQAIAVADLDLSRVRITAGDFNVGDLEKLLLDEKHLHDVAVPTLELAGERPTILFGTTVKHAHQLAAVINRHKSGAARALDGGTDGDLRRRTVDEFARGEFQFLCNCSLFTEGFDCPSVACISVARPTQSRALYGQMIGRGTRLSPETGKQDLLVLDFRGSAGRHALASSLDVLAGKASAGVRAKAAQLVSASPQLDLLEALDEAARLEREEAARAQAAEEEARRRGILYRPGYTARDVGVFTAVEVLLGIAMPPHEIGVAADRADLAALEKRGIDKALLGEIDGNQARALRAELERREAAGLCSFKQALLLAKNHYVNPGTYTAARAGALIGQLANRWSRRASV